MMKKYYVYIMTNRAGTLYTGVTSDLEQRVRQHKLKFIPGFTSRYNINQLAWFQDFDDVNQALSAEKTIKAWRRSKKISLIEEVNPEWRDLAAALVIPRSAEESAPPLPCSRTPRPTSG